MTEAWRPIGGYEGLYEVSSLGRVRSLERTVMRSNGSPKRVSGRVLATNRVSAMGYHSVHLYDHGPRVRHYIHTLVLEAFVAPRDAGMVVANLRWDTSSANNQDIIAHGNHANVNKTACLRDHPLSGENLYVNPTSGGRQCRRCIRDARRTRLAAT